MYINRKCWLWLILCLCAALSLGATQSRNTVPTTYNASFLSNLSTHMQNEVYQQTFDICGPIVLYGGDEKSGSET